ncbi:hypothetical protein VTP01DRAFT_5198 [Rhizomucor pusillus]|uniref:uncharacterized protein n=1 Tax=Rhizomucor pusillus TaxID=4840 RepID=UPI00374498F8
MRNCPSLKQVETTVVRIFDATPVALLIAIFIWAYWAFNIRLSVRLVQDGHFAQGILYIIYFHPLFFLCIWSYYKVICTSPGRTKDILKNAENDESEDIGLLNEQQRDPEEGRPSVAILNVENANESQVSLHRTLSGDNSSSRSAYPLITVKRCGARRYCQKCQLDKFDRTHHCRSCKSCILKMDHHCPWVNNCVGFYNYKFFYLFILYASLVCVYVFAATLPPTLDVLNGPMSIFGLDFNWPVLVFVSGIFGLFLIPFTGFHTRQLLKNRTTIEFYEKANFRLGRVSNGRIDIMRSRYFNPWDIGAKRNFIQVMGANPWKWFIPVGRPAGTGCQFPINEYAYNTLATGPDDQAEEL